MISIIDIQLLCSITKYIFPIEYDKILLGKSLISTKKNYIIINLDLILC